MNEIKAKKSGFLFVFLTVALDMLSIGILIPILPNLVNQLAGGIVADSAIIMGWIGSSWAVAQFFSMPIMGALSDKFGRKPIFFISNFGQGIAYLLAAMAPNLWFLWFARVFAGAMSGSISAAYSYIADTEEPKDRAVKFGQLGAAFGLGFIIGPAIGGILGDISIRLPLYAASVISILASIYGLFALKESLKPENRKEFSWKRANPISSFKFFKDNKNIRKFAIIKFLNDLAHVVLPSTFVLYALHKFGWTQKESGLMMGLVGVLSAIVQGGLMRIIIKKLGEKKALFFGLICGALAFFGYSIVQEPYQIVFAVIIAAFWGVYGASVQTYLTSKVSPSEQGRLQGALGASQAFTSIIGPLIFTNIFSYFISHDNSLHFPGAAFLLASLLVTTSIILAIGFTKNEPNRMEN